MLIKYDNLGGNESFLPAFLHNKEIYSLNLDSCLFLGLVSFAYYTHSSPIRVNTFRVHIHIPISRIHLDLISYCYVRTIQMLVSYHVLVFL